jgi:hypothetical protein
MKNLYATIVASLLLISASAQVNWAVKGGLWAYDYGYGVVTDNAKKVYVAGKFEFNAKFGSETANCQGNHDAYIAKYTSGGSIEWLRTLGGPNGDYAWGITTDGANFFYVSGEIEGTSPIIFSNSTVTLVGNGDNDAFVAKYDLNGNCLWAKNEGIASSEKALAVTHDAAGNVYIGGYFTDNTKFNGNNITGFGGRDIFVAKYDPNGNFLWMQKAGGAGRDEVKKIKADNNGNVYICGMFTGSAAFGSGNVSSADSFQDSYVAKMSGSDGSWQWVRKGAAVLDDVAWDITIDNSGNIYTTGEFNSYISFESPSSGVATTGNTNIFVAKLDPSGNVVWIKNAGGPILDRARGIGTDGTTIYITGQIGSESPTSMAQFGSTSLHAMDSMDVFIAAMDASGNFLWATVAGGPADTYENLGYESGIAITANSDAVYGTGGMLLDTLIANCVSVDFAGTTLQGYRRTDMYLVSIGKMGVGLSEMQLDADVALMPNPSAGVFNIDVTKVSGTLELTTYNMVGQIIEKKTVQGGTTTSLDLSAQHNGVYITEIKADKAVIRRKIIVQH